MSDMIINDDSSGANGGNNFVGVSQGNPCPVCGGVKWPCFFVEDSGVVCGHKPNRQNKKTKNGSGWFHRIGEFTACSDGHISKGRPKLPRDNQKIRGLLRCYSQQLRMWDANRNGSGSGSLARDIGVPVEALRFFVGLGLAYSDDDHHIPCWSIPERNARGRVTGLALRVADKQSPNRKLVVKGGARGLYLPQGWQKQDPSGPLFLVEGFSDTATLVAAGRSAVGRYNNIGGVDIVSQLLKLNQFPSDRPILWMGENDQKADGSHAGNTRAQAQQLAHALEREVHFAFPPDSAKDVRDWFGSPFAAELTWHESGLAFLGKTLASAEVIRSEQGTYSASTLNPQRQSDCRFPGPSELETDTAEQCCTPFLIDPTDADCGCRRGKGCGAHAKPPAGASELIYTEQRHIQCESATTPASSSQPAAYTNSLAPSPRADRCTQPMRVDLKGVGEKTQGTCGRRMVECRNLTDCPHCLEKAKQVWSSRFGPMVAGSDRPISVTRIPVIEWKKLRDHLDRLVKRDAGKPPSYVVVHRAPDAAELFVLFFGAPSSSRLTVTPAREASVALCEVIDSIAPASGVSGRRWRPLRTSRDLVQKKPAKKTGCEFVRIGPFSLENGAVRRVYLRHGGRDAERTPAGWEPLIRIDEGGFAGASDELRLGPVALRFLPTLPGFRGMDDLHDFHLTGELPHDLPPLSEMPTDLAVVHERLDELFPGLSETVWAARDGVDPREVLRGAIWRSRTDPWPAAYLPSSAAPQLPVTKLPSNGIGQPPAAAKTSNWPGRPVQGTKNDVAPPEDLDRSEVASQTPHPAVAPPTEPQPPASSSTPTGQQDELCNTDTHAIIAEIRRLAIGLSSGSRRHAERVIAGGDRDGLEKLLRTFRRLSSL